MSVNKVMILGNLGADPELRYTQNQNAVATLRIATNERRKNAEGEWVDQTEWHSIVVWGKQAENCAQYLSKGRQAFVEGRLQTRKWQDKEGRDRYTTEIVAQNVQFIGGRGDSAGAGGGYSQPKGQVKPAGTMPPLESVSFDDDDIPF